MRNKMIFGLFCVGIFLMLIFRVIPKRDRWKERDGDNKEITTTVDRKTTEEKGLTEEEKANIFLEAKQEYNNLHLKIKDQTKNRDGADRFRKQQKQLKEEKSLQDKNKEEEEAKEDRQEGENEEKDENKNGGRIDEEKLCKDHGIEIDRPKVTVENDEIGTDTIKINFGEQAKISEVQTEVVIKKENGKIEKNNLDYEDLVMTDEEEAAFRGYTMEEWGALSDKEKFGSCDDSRANTKFGGRSMGYDFE